MKALGSCQPLVEVGESLLYDLDIIFDACLLERVSSPLLAPRREGLGRCNPVEQRKNDLRLEPTAGPRGSCVPDGASVICEPWAILGAMSLGASGLTTLHRSSPLMRPPSSDGKNRPREREPWSSRAHRADIPQVGAARPGCLLLGVGLVGLVEERLRHEDGHRYEGLFALRSMNQSGAVAPCKSHRRMLVPASFPAPAHGVFRPRLKRTCRG